ncbi:MAG: small-conductance mechanosensitive channel [Motiliproteus sp.]|jgi:small-conductance mechanosensitive channel
MVNSLLAKRIFIKRGPCRLPRLLAVISLLITLVTVSFTAGAAQPSAAGLQVEAAIGYLTDKEVRQMLIERLEAADAAESQQAQQFNPAIVAYQIQSTLGAVRQELGAIAQAVTDLPGVFPEAWRRVTAGDDRRPFSEFLFSFLGVLALGALLERFLIARVSPYMANKMGPPDNLRDKASRLGLRMFVRLIGLLVFIVTAAVTYLALFDVDDQQRVTFYFYLGAILMFRAAGVFSHAFYAPDQPTLRLPHYPDREARFFHRSALVTVALGAFGFFTCALFGTLGIFGHVHGLLLIMVGTLTVSGLIVAAARGRRAITADLQFGFEGNTLRLGFAALWPWLYCFIIALIWFGLVIGELTDVYVRYGAALFTIGLLSVLPSLEALLEREARRYADTGVPGRALAVRGVRLVTLLLSLLLLITGWGFRPVELIEIALGGSVTNALLQVGTTLLFAYALWQLVTALIDRQIAKEDAALAASGDTGEVEMGGTGLSRVRTLLPLFRRTFQIALATITSMVALSSMGVDIAPLLAGAGVLGLAIGFGSQALVRDIVSGVFFLIDDAFRLGEYIDVGDVKGTVEQMSIRSLRLRHHLGAVHTVPFGEIKTLTNFSRDWVIMKLKFRVPFDTDVLLVKKLFKKIGQQLLESPEIGADFIEPFKSQGVLEVDDYGLIIRAKFTAKPGKQFMIRKEAFTRVQASFEENGIEFAKPIFRVAVDHSEPKERLKTIEENAVMGVAGAALKPPPVPV